MEIKPSILYVDDEETNLLLFEFNFNNQYEVHTALSGFKGLELLRNNRETGIVISDMNMPGMNGIEFIRLVKTEFPRVICCILTGYDITLEIEDALRSKLIHKYFSKPFKIDEIGNAIAQLRTDSVG